MYLPYIILFVGKDALGIFQIKEKLMSIKCVNNLYTSVLQLQQQ